MKTIIPTPTSQPDNGEKIDDLQRQLKQATLRRDICRCILGSRVLQTGLKESATAIVHAIENDYVAVWLSVAEGERLKRQAGAGKFVDMFERESANELPVSDKSLIGKVAAGQAPLLVDGVSFVEDSGNSWPPDAAAWSFVGIPLMIDGGCRGVLAAYRQTPFSIDARRLLNAAADELERHLSCLQETEKSRDLEQLRKVAIHSSPVAIVRLDEEQRMIAWNPSARRVFGWPTGQVAGQRVPFIAASSRGQFDAALKLVFSGRSMSPVAMTGRRWDGREFEFEISAYPLMDNDGNVEQAVLFVTDRTEQSILEQRLKAHVTVSDTMTVSDSIQLTAPRLIQSLCKNFGWSHGEYWQVDETSADWNCIARWNDSTADAASTSDFHGDGAVVQAILENVEVTRSPFWKRNVVAAGRLLQSAAAASDLHDLLAVPVLAGGQVVGVMAFYNFHIPEPDRHFLATLTAIADHAADLIEKERAANSLQRLEENLQQSQKMQAIGLLAGGIAHDFNNLLTVILGHSEIALEQLDDESPLKPLLVEVEEAGGRAATLTQQLLTFSRKQVFEPKVLDLNAQIRNMERMLRRLIGEHIEWQTVLAPHLHHVKADPVQMEQVLLNLAVNARDAMPEGGRLTISTRNLTVSRTAARAHPELDSGDYVGLTVSDNGCGMDEQTRRRIFEPFFTTKERHKGTGMGLSTVYGIVRRSGGIITVKSQPGHGTTFDILLPRVCDVLLPIEADAPTTNSALGTETILLVEDEHPVRSLVATVLTTRGYTVLQAANGMEAIDILREQGKQIDLLLSDVMMPGMNGPQAAEAMLRLNPQLRVMFMSGYTDAEIPLDSRSNDECIWLRKPFTSNDLAARVRKALN